MLEINLFQKQVLFHIKLYGIVLFHIKLYDKKRTFWKVVFSIYLKGI